MIESKESKCFSSSLPQAHIRNRKMCAFGVNCVQITWKSYKVKSFKSAHNGHKTKILKAICSLSFSFISSKCCYNSQQFNCKSRKVILTSTFTSPEFYHIIILFEMCEAILSSCYLIFLFSSFILSVSLVRVSIILSFLLHPPVILFTRFLKWVRDKWCFFFYLSLVMRK